MSPRAVAPSPPVLAALAALAAVLTACEERRSVTLLFGPTETTLTAGFACRADDGTPLIQRARTGSDYAFQIVIDSFDLGASYPGCRGEEVLAACGGGRCTKISRACFSVTVPQAAITSQEAILSSLRAQLGHPRLIADAPASPIVVRTVATTQSCDEVLPASGAAPRLDPARAIGCAHSCPVVLDTFRGSLGVALDVLDDHCAPQVAACTQFSP